jgi:hypothetical protein
MLWSNWRAPSAADSGLSGALTPLVNEHFSPPRLTLGGTDALLPLDLPLGHLEPALRWSIVLRRLVTSRTARFAVGVGVAAGVFTGVSALPGAARAATITSVTQPLRPNERITVAWTLEANEYVGGIEFGASLRLAPDGHFESPLQFENPNVLIGWIPSKRTEFNDASIRDEGFYAVHVYAYTACKPLFPSSTIVECDPSSLKWSNAVGFRVEPPPPPPPSQPRYARPGWATASNLSDAVERRGISRAGRRYAIDVASCFGLRRYGVSRAFDREYFHRFRCSLIGANDRLYTAWILITRSNLSHFWWRTYKFRRY